MASIAKIARRSFLFGAVALGAGVAFGWWKYRTPYTNPLLATLADDAASLNPYVLLDPQGITLIARGARSAGGRSVRIR